MVKSKIKVLKTSSDWFSIAFFFGALILFPIANIADTSFNQINITVAIGLLTLIAIFYPLFFRQKFDYKTEKNVLTEKDKTQTKFEELSTKLKIELKQERPNIKNIRLVTREVREILDDFTFVSEETDLKRHFKAGMIFLLASLLLIWLDYAISGKAIFNFQELNISLHFLGAYSLLYGFYRSLRLVIASLVYFL